MGAKHVIMFEDKGFSKINKYCKMANLYSVSLIDCTFFCFSFLYKEKNFLTKIRLIKYFFEILNSEKALGMDLDAYENATKEFNSRYQKINWEKYDNQSFRIQ